MKRLLFVVGGAFLLILAGYLMGAKKSGDYHRQLEQATADLESHEEMCEQKVVEARRDGELWRIRAELLLASQDVAENNYGNASRRIQRVIDRLETKAETQPESAALLAMVKKSGDAVLNMDSTAATSLRQAAAELGKRLDY